MTSGTPESTQNWVLPGFQNSLDLASMSPLEAKAISSSATVTSASGGHLRASEPLPQRVRAPASGTSVPLAPALSAPSPQYSPRLQARHLRARLFGSTK